MKKLIMIVLLGSFVFSGVSFNKGIVYGDLDKDAGLTVNHTMGVDFDINDTMSIGWDSGVGMVVKAAGPAGATVRIGYNTTVEPGSSTFGVSYDWWSGGDAIQTSIGTYLDYMTAGGGVDATTVGLNLSWGF
jgi:hypothetical protein